MTEYKPCPVCHKTDNVHMFRIRHARTGFCDYQVACGNFKCRLWALFGKRASWGANENEALKYWDWYAESLDWKRLD
ncbi:MAG: hypothetical protein IJV47_00030 [Candidatus Methanomethylophilaceae archaeon]|nr:hypothetical protein [Candidatus Methanomethylophilaceae archaeon]MBQ9688984.1 hypothetical protein [Candidatus Methanomethylophilaceae archaeon]